MTLTETDAVVRRRRSLGLWSFVAALFAVVGVSMIAVSTYTASGGPLEPPDWLRIVTIPLFPLGALASAVLGVLTLRRDASRVWAVAGLVLTALSVVAFVAMIGSVRY